MDNNRINKHLCNNTSRSFDRGYQGRMMGEGEAIENILRREEQGYDCEGNMINKKPECDKNKYCNMCDHRCENDHGGEVYIANVGRMAYRNNSYRESIWTGEYLQTTLMSICRGGDIGLEIHEDTDQYIRVEYGSAIALTGHHANCLCNKYKLCQGDAIYIPAGTWHNIVNAGRCDLKLSSTYAPSHHPKCTVQKYK